MNRAVFLDRDGVINRKPPEGGYVTAWVDLEFLPGAAAAISQLNKAGYKVIVVSNQRCIAKGLITVSEMDAIHLRMCRDLASAGATIDGVYYCPHEKQPACTCRKPAPGMLLSAARDHAIDLAESWIIGDSDVDVAAGRNAGCKTARLIVEGESPESKADIVSSSLVDAIQEILRSELIAA
jgi:D-glycero-D-manno-heptose 1,7-bisphosphate phosphatase